MKLADYLKANGITATAFAAKIARSTATVSRLSRGRQRPDWSTLEAIRAATDGNVTANDFHGAERSAGRAA